MNEYQKQKQALRREASARRAKVWQQGYDQMETICQMISQRFFSEFPLTKKDCVALSLSFKDEVDLAPIILELDHMGVSIALPRIEASTNNRPLLSFRLYRPNDPLEYEKFGTRAPLASAPVVYPTLFIVPMLAFNREGYRLGYGGGFYDTTLQEYRAEKRPFIAVGIAFSTQEISNLPVEAHDQKLDFILTEREFIKINPKLKAK